VPAGGPSAAGEPLGGSRLYGKKGGASYAPLSLAMLPVRGMGEYERRVRQATLQAVPFHRPTSYRMLTRAGCEFNATDCCVAAHRRLTRAPGPVAQTRAIPAFQFLERHRLDQRRLASTSLPNDVYMQKTIFVFFYRRRDYRCENRYGQANGMTCIHMMDIWSHCSLMRTRLGVLPKSGIRNSRCENESPKSNLRN
jgi:hypothetical protein